VEIPGACVIKLGGFDRLLKPAYLKEFEAKQEEARKKKNEQQEERIRSAEDRLLLRKGGKI